MDKNKFIHLHVHSDYSIKDSLIKLEDLVKAAKLLKLPAIAITDSNNLFGIIKFYIYALNNGIKPIIGIDIIIKEEEEDYEVTLLAINNLGFNNIKILITEAYKKSNILNGPKILKKWFIKYNEGLIILSGIKGDIGRNILNNNKKKIKDNLEFYKFYFKERFYLEIMRTGRQNEEEYLNAVIKLAEINQIPVVATNDVRFINKEDFYAHEIRVSINNGYAIDNIKRPQNYSDQQYLRSEKEMCELFSDIPEALKNTVEIAKRCNVTITFGEYFFPQFNMNDLKYNDPNKYLIICSKKGLEKKLYKIFPDITEKENKRILYYKRLIMELKVINKMGLSGYFLIIMEFVQWAKTQNIPVGPGRGSGAGSLVAYSLNITDINPLEFNLLFERFLNPERILLPDFDIDFCMKKRDLVIQHVSKLYGRNEVAQIITFGTMTAKSVIRDVGRVLSYPYKFIDSLSKLIPSDIKITLDIALYKIPKLLSLYKTDKEVKVLIDISRKLEGTIRNAGKHAGGVVISPKKITLFTPLYCDKTHKCHLTQFDKTDLEYIGLIKLDFLGLKTLTIIKWAIKMINIKKKNHNLKFININDIPLNDKKAFNILKKAETKSIFQLESKGIKYLITRLKPQNFEELIALIALFRPGPLKSGMVENFIKRKHGKENIYYPDIKWQHKLLIPILKHTYGIIIYQEQVMLIAKVLAGYTLGKADILRVAMSKKQKTAMANERIKFIKGAKKKGINHNLSVKIFNLLENFAGYGFNKSHSTAYALISYQTLWLKANYSYEFMAAVISADINNIDKIVFLLQECTRIGIKIIPPDINNSYYYFYVNNLGIIYGLGAIKGIGKVHIEYIIENRNKLGKFNSFLNFCIRLPKLNKKILEQLICSGAFDSIGPHRAALLAALNEAIKISKRKKNDLYIGQLDILSNKYTNTEIEKIYKKVLPWPIHKILKGELESLGIYFTAHPIILYKEEREYYSHGNWLKDIKKEYKKNITIVGVILSLKIYTNKIGTRIGICILDDSTDILEVILFNEILDKYINILKKGKIIIAYGKLKKDKFNNQYKLIIINIREINEARENDAIGINLIIKNLKLLTPIKNCLKKYVLKNKIPLYMVLKNKFINTNLRVYASYKLLNILRNIIGNENVKIIFN